MLTRSRAAHFSVLELPYPAGLRAGGCSFATLATVLAEGQALRVCNLHLPLDPVLRLTCARALAERLRALPGDAPLVVCGDFNEAADGPAVSSLLDLGLADAWATVQATDGATFPNPGPRRRIDLVLVRGLQVTAARLLGARPSASGLYASDHLGLRVQATARPKARAASQIAISESTTMITTPLATLGSARWSLKTARAASTA